MNNGKVNTRKNSSEPTIEVKTEDGQVSQKKYGKRTPIYAQKKLGIKDRPGWTRRLVNDKPGRIESFLEAGWTPVDGSDQLDDDGRLQSSAALGSKHAPVVNTKPGAMNFRAIWMEIPTELFEEDQREKERLIAQHEEKIKPKATNEDSNVFSGAHIK